MHGEARAQEPIREWPSRASSCQLPVLVRQSLERGFHRSSQSLQIDREQKCSPCPSGLPPRCPTYTALPEYRGGKQEKHEKLFRAGASAYSVATFISVVVFLVPAAFYAGHSAAMASPACNARHLHQSLKMSRVGISGGGAGRQLSHDSGVESRKAAEDTSRSMFFKGITSMSRIGRAFQAGVPRNKHSEAQIATDSEAMHNGLASEAPLNTTSHPDILFVTWIAFGEYGDGGLKTHNFHRVDMRWADIARKSHPGCKIGLILDQDTQLSSGEAVDFLHRLPVDKKVYGRNEYNDFYHWQARYTFLEKLRDEGNDKYNVVFLDPDVFVLDDIHEVFEQQEFDYATTISEGLMQPVNGAMHFVRAQHYTAAVDVLKGVLSLFQLKPEMGFTAGQQAYSDYFELTLEPNRVSQLQDRAIEKGMACHQVLEGSFNICYVMCTTYNYWEGCTNHPGLRGGVIDAGAAVVPHQPDDYEAAHVKVLHFIAYRKLGMQRVYDAYMAGGIQSAHAAWASLPHSEDGYKQDPSFGEEV